MKSAGKARSNGLYRHIRTSKEIIRNLLNYSNEKPGKIISLSDILKNPLLISSIISFLPYLFNLILPTGGNIPLSIKS